VRAIKDGRSDNAAEMGAAQGIQKAEKAKVSETSERCEKHERATKYQWSDLDETVGRCELLRKDTAVRVWQGSELQQGCQF